MKSKFLGLASATLFSCLAMGAKPAPTLETKVEQEKSSFDDVLEHWEHIVEFGGYTAEESEFARKKVYEVVKAVGETVLDGETFYITSERRVFQVKEDAMITISIQYGGKYAEFEDNGFDGMHKGTFDKVRVPWGEDQVWEYPFNKEAKVVAYYYGSEFGKTKDIGLVYWRKDVDDLIGDFNTAMVINYFKMLQLSEEGIITIADKEYNLLE